MTPEISSAHHRAAAAFNEVASAARIAIEALAKIAAESGRQSRSSRIHLLKSKSLSAFRNRLSGSVRPRRVAILPEGPPRARIAHIANPRSQLLQHWGSGREHRRELTPTRHPPQGSPREMRAGPPCAGIGAASAAAQGCSSRTSTRKETPAMQTRHPAPEIAEERLDWFSYNIEPDGTQICAIRPAMQ